VTWEEVAGCAASGDPGDLVFDAHDVRDRIADQGDLFAPVVSLVQRLPGA
jgi:bifunctional non-homologous end joining protein LigD